MEELTRPRKEIEGRLSRIKNYDEVRSSPYWDEWINVVFCWGMLGFDNIEAYTLVHGKVCELVKVEATTLKGLKERLKAQIDPYITGLVIGVMIPQPDLEIVHKIQEMILLHMNEDCEMLMQAKKSHSYNLIALTVYN